MIYHGHGIGYGANNTAPLTDLEREVRKATKTLRAHRHEFDSIVVQGMSGVIVGAPTALRLRKPLVIVRKDNDNSHHGAGKLINVDALGSRAVFLDDFIAGGSTQKRVDTSVTQAGSYVVASYLYRDDEWEPSREN
jgi:adenine/guanine phosphoribosyltransferase-like PRPP-binding protein